jgi:hypothetical protein
MTSIQIETLRSTDQVRGDEAVVIIRVVGANVAIAISNQLNGDAEVTIDANMTIKVADALRRAADLANAQRS